jgi:hypothetical protein
MDDSPEAYGIAAAAGAIKALREQIPDNRQS